MQVKLWLLGLVIFCAFLSAIGQLFLKLGSTHISTTILSWATNWRLILGVALYGISAFLFIIALKFGNLSILYPIVATSYIWVALLATFILGEVFPATKWLGIALILAGVAVVVR